MTVTPPPDGMVDQFICDDEDRHYDELPPHDESDVPPTLTARVQPEATVPALDYTLSSATTPRQIVECLLAEGYELAMWAPVGDSKGPLEKGWPKKTYTLADYRDGYRVGIKTGVELRPGKVLHDADIDWAAGAVIAQSFLPVTGLMFGRASKKVSHAFYTTSEAIPTMRYEDPIDKVCLIELRGTKKDGSIGMQTMAPPSVWTKTGQREQLAFITCTGPLHINDPADLKHPVCMSAIGMLLAKRLGRHGFGHEARLEWAGFLLRAGVSAADLKTMGKSMSIVTDNTEVNDVATVVDSTLKSLAADDKKVRGGPALAKRLGEHGHAIVARILEWMGKSDTAAHLTIRKASDIPDERLEKSFSGRLVRGSIALLAGPGEGGKGMLLADTIARLTTGAAFPNELHRRPPSSVLVCVTEDSAGRVKARLRAAGADLDLVFFVEGPEVKRGGLTMPSPMLLDDDAGALVRHAKQIDARALFLETVVEHFGDRSGKTRRSTNNEADVRSALAPFRAACSLAGLYGLGVIHPRKSVEGSLDDSISGSAAFRNVARAAHHIYRDPDDESDDPVRLLFSSKTNYLARRPPTLRFRIKGWDEVLGVPCTCMPAECDHEGRVIWEADPVDVRTAEEIWQAIAERSRARRDVTVEKGEAFLTALMVDGVINMAPKEIFKRASDDEGLSKAAITRAKERLKLVSVKNAEFPASVIAWKEPEEDY